MATTKQYTVICAEDFREIIMAEFAMLGFDSFQETDAGFIAHAETEVDQVELTEIISRYQDLAQATLVIEEVEQVNWNKKWEESYDPIVIGDKILVRASFHKTNPSLPFEIIVNPKMSFGTGHHETTGLMMEHQLELDHKNRKVLDAGCGTGILAILAGKLGASEIWAYDNDEWVRDNIQENFEINQTTSELLIGTIESLAIPGDFDIILANINKNILLHDIPYYANKLQPGGRLLLSGFYKEDLPDIEAMTRQCGLTFEDSKTKNRWMAARFSK